MSEVSIVIPNYNGIQYLDKCLKSLQKQTLQNFEVLLVDNGSTDGSIEFLETNFPKVKLIVLDENYGFCRAVNEGIRASVSPYVFLLNNDTKVHESCVEELLKAVKKSDRIFSCAAKMLQMDHENLVDDAGNYYNALGWAFARGRGRPSSSYTKICRIFAACGGAAIYQKSVFKEIGLFDESHFAYLEDVDVGYRARIFGYENIFIPSALVYHVGSGTSGSRYNEFKIRFSSRNSVYLAYKNMPLLQLILNSPFLFLGFLIKTFFFLVKGLGREYAAGIKNGFAMSKNGRKVKFYWKNTGNYVKIQLELWAGIVRRAFY